VLDQRIADDLPVVVVGEVAARRGREDQEREQGRDAEEHAGAVERAPHRARTSTPDGSRGC
jgi:hypothetical protein